MKTLICISSKSPNPLLHTCISSLYKIQVKNDPNYKICVVDSDSNDFSHYEIVRRDFPEVDLCFVKNKNYEYGAWKYALEKYSDFDLYFCIQDSIILARYIHLSIVNDTRAYIHYHKSGYHSHLSIKQEGILNLRDSGLPYQSLIDTKFTLAQHSIMIVTRNILQDIFSTLTHPPENKNGSCFYERNFGLFFLCKNIHTEDLSHYVTKHHGKRF
jgi:hypothetical protein